jgi:putative flippase GtrA
MKELKEENIDITNINEESDKKNKLIKRKNKIHDLMKKLFSKEVILYVVFGVLTTLVNIGSFAIMTSFLHFDSTNANNIAIVLAVIFAYFTNKDLVFHSQAKGFGERFIEFSKFILGRLLTMFIESIGGSLMFRYVPIPELVSKCLITVIVIILNFFISKFFAFKSNKNDE